MSSELLTGTKSPCLAGRTIILSKGGRVAGIGARPPQLGRGPKMPELPRHIRKGQRTIHGVEGHSRGLLPCEKCGRVGPAHRASCFLRDMGAALG